MLWGTLDTLRRGLDRVLTVTVGIQLVLLTAVVVYAVVCRKFGASLSWYDEVASIQLAWLTYYGAALASLRRAHIGFPGLVKSLPRGPRIAAVLFGEIVIVAFFAVLAWTGWWVWQVLEGMRLVSLTSVPVQFTQSCIPIAAGLVILAQLLTAPTVLCNAARGHSAP